MADSTQTPRQPGRGNDEERPELLHDRKLVDVLRQDDFQGLNWDRVVEEWCRYAYPIISRQIRTKRIIRECQKKRIPLSHGAWLDEDVEELTIETIARAAVRFRNDLRAGRWSKDGGASLATFFVGLCILQFPNVHRDWQREERRWVPAGSLDALGELASGQQQVADPSLDGDPAHLVELRAEVDALLEPVPETVKQMVRLWSDGYSYEEIAELLEVSRIDVGNGLSRFKERARRQQSSSTEWEEG